MGRGRPAPAPKAQPGTGTTTVTYEVKDLGIETVAQLKAHHYKIKIHSVTTGCAGDSDNTLEREVWVSDLPHLVCPHRDRTGDYSIATGGASNPNPCKMTVVQKGDFQLFMQSCQGEPVKDILYHDGKPMMTTELVDYSSAPLADNLFDVEGYREVESQEFQMQMQQKMMQNFKRP
jgi:hypothetical protein